MSNTIVRRTETVPLFQGDDLVAIQDAREAFNLVVQSAGSGRLGDSPATDAAAKYDAVVADATTRAVMVKVRALGRRTYRKLRADSPPREDNLGDAGLGFNTEAMADVLLEYVSDDDFDDRTIVEPVFENKGAIVKWLDDLNDGDFSTLFAAAIRVNEGVGVDPKDSLTSRLAAISGVTLT